MDWFQAWVPPLDGHYTSAAVLRPSPRQGWTDKGRSLTNKLSAHSSANDRRQVKPSTTCFQPKLNLGGCCSGGWPGGGWSRVAGCVGEACPEGLGGRVWGSEGGGVDVAARDGWHHWVPLRESLLFGNWQCLKAWSLWLCRGW